MRVGNFKKLLPLARENNVRIVLPNRRDYPGSTPFSPDEVARLAELANAPAGTPGAAEGTQAEMKARARELYDYLVDLVQTQNIPRAQGKTGGIVVAGWSIGATWITALLAHVAEFPVGDVRLGEYVRRLVLYGAWRAGCGVVCAGGCQRMDRLRASGATLLPSTACSESTSRELPVPV